MNLRSRIHAAHLSPAEAQIADYLLEHGEEVMKMKIQDFARTMHVSRSTIIRFAKALNLEGWKQLKIELNQWLQKQKDPKTQIDANLPFEVGDNSEAIAAKLALLYQNTLQDILDGLDYDQLEMALQFLEKAEFIYVITAYHNLSMANNFADKLLSIHRRIQVATSTQTQDFICHNCTSQDAVIFISYSAGYSPLNQLIERAYNKKAKVILITGSVTSVFDQYIHARLQLGGKESRLIRLAQFSSDLEVHFLLDILYGAMLNRMRKRMPGVIESEKDYLSLLDVRGWKGTY